jgi:hypothetical protein
MPSRATTNARSGRRSGAGRSPLARRAVPRRHLAFEHEAGDEAFDTFKALADAQPTPTVLNNLGIVQLRRGTPNRTADVLLQQGRRADPNDPTSCSISDTRIGWIAIHRPRSSGFARPFVAIHHADAHYVLGAALAGAGNAAEATRERELARRLSSAYEPGKKPGGDTVPRGLERVKNEIELPRAGRIDARLAMTDQRDQSELATFYLDRGRRLFQQENDRDAVVELNHALYVSPYLADAHLLLGRIALGNGRSHDGIESLKIGRWSA